jgi:hypothetical protein
MCSGRRRSDANRSSATGQRRSSALSRWARSTRLSIRAPSASSAAMDPRASGPRSSRINPSAERGGRPIVSSAAAESDAWAAGAAARRPRSSTSARTREAVDRSSQRRVAALVRPATSSSARRSAEIVASARSRERTTSTLTSPGSSRGAVPLRPRPTSSTSSGESRSIARCVRRRRSATGNPANSSSQRGTALSPGRSGRLSKTSARPTAITSAEYRLFTSARRSPDAAARANSGKSVGLASGIAPDPMTIRPSAGSIPSRMSMRSRAPKGTSSGAPWTT